jgi:hypothetical protein
MPHSLIHPFIFIIDDNSWMNEGMNEWMKEWMNEGINEDISISSDLWLKSMIDSIFSFDREFNSSIE